MPVKTLDDVMKNKKRPTLMVNNLEAEMEKLKQADQAWLEEEKARATQ
jgi:hypothetical protein